MNRIIIKKDRATMNILYINEDNYGGGSSIALLYYVQAMIERGHNVFVITRDNDGFIIDELRKLKAKVFVEKFRLCYYPLCRNPYIWIKSVWGIMYRWKRLGDLISTVIVKEKIDIVHTNVGPLPYALSVCQKYHIPHVWHHREYFDMLTKKCYFPYKGDFLRRIHQCGNYNICITRGILKYLGLDEKKTNKVIFDGVFKLSEIPQIEQESKESYILFVGAIVRNKAPHILIQAFAQFHKLHPEYKLLMAGRFSHYETYYKECEKCVDCLGIREYVEFLGYRKDARELMKRAKAVVVPTIFEGFGFVMVESMLNKTLVIGNNTTGTKEQFDLGLKQTGDEIGLRFSNVEDLVTSLDYAVTHDTTDMCNRAYNVVCNNYTVEKCVEETERFYMYVIDDYNKNIKRKSLNI